MWFYLCGKCLNAVIGIASIESIPKSQIKKWRKDNDPRGKCEWCGKEETKFLVDAEVNSFDPDSLLKMGIKTNH